MPRVGQILLLTVSFLLATAGSAGAAEPVVRSVVLQPDSTVWGQPRPVFRFREDSTLERISRLRNLSFVTLARTQRTRLFLGVNEDGLVGLHFNTLSRYGDDRVLELSRLKLKD